MDGLFRTDISNDKFNPTKHFSRVLMQQGRVQLDADWNEQTDILLYYMRTLVTDLVGPFWGSGDGFNVVLDTDSSQNSLFSIKSGRYYVDGILVENDEDHPYTPPETTSTSQTSTGTTAKGSGRRRQRANREQGNTSPYLIYLDVWERQVSPIEDTSILEVALKGPDTATRAKVMSYIRSWDHLPSDLPTSKDAKKVKSYMLGKWSEWLQQWYPSNRGYLKAGVNQENGTSTDPCITAPSSHYRGIENQLYRVEIHDGGSVSSGSRATEGPTFKWSRENGSVVLPIDKVEGNIIKVKSLGHDNRFGLKKNDWVEIIDDDTVLDSPNPLSQVETVDYVNSQIILKTPVSSEIGSNPLLRRWDQHAGDSDDPHSITLNNKGVAILQEDKWLTLEDGVQIYFQPGQEATNTTPTYRSGDYWLIPARTVLGNIIWPQGADGSMPLPPHGVKHHYAPLAVIYPNESGTVTEDGIVDVRNVITPLTEQQ